MKRLLTSGITLLIMAVWLISPVAVLAQDEVPPAEEEPVVQEAITDEEEPPEQIPESVEVVVLDQGGTEVPVSSFEVKVISSLADPMYCPCGVSPQADPSFDSVEDDGAVCEAFSTLAGAVNYAKTAGDTCGVIYIDANYDAATAGESSNAPLVIDEDDFGTVFDLTIWGGWDLTNFIDLGTSSTLDMPLQIQDFNDADGSGMTLLHLILGQPTSAPSQSVLTISNSNNVRIDTVTIEDETDHDAVRIENVDNLTITSSIINDYFGGSALYISGMTNSLIDDIYVFEDGYAGVGGFCTCGDGIYMEYSHGNTLSNIDITEKSYGSGLELYYSNRNTLNDIQVEENNYGIGVKFNNSENNTVNSLAIYEVNHGGGLYLGYSDRNVFDGLYIIEYNDGFGLKLYDSDRNTIQNFNIDEYNDGSAFVAYDSDQNILSGENHISETGDGTGLSFYDSDRNTLSGIEIDEYGSGPGIHFDESDRNTLTNLIVNEHGGGPAIHIENSARNTLTGLDVFGGSYGPGIHLNYAPETTLRDITVVASACPLDSDSGGPAFSAEYSDSLFIDGMTAKSDNKVGALIGGSDTVTLLNIVASNNGTSGLNIWNSSDIYLDNVTASDNGSNGAYFSGNYGELTILNSAFNNNGWGNDEDLKSLSLMSSDPQIGICGSGLRIEDHSGGLIYLNKVVSSGNYGDGIFISSDSAVNADVFNSTIAHNGYNGLYFESEGILRTCNVIIAGNDEDEVYFNGGTWVELPAYMCTDIMDAAPEALAPIIVLVQYETERGLPISAAFASDRGMVFLLQKEEQDGSKTLMGQASLPGGAVPAGALVTMTEVVDSTLPAALPDGTSYVGPAFSMAASGMDGIAIEYLNGTMEVKFRLPEGLTIPEGQKLAIQLYQNGTWTTLPTFFGGDFAYAYTGSLGTFVLSLVPVE